MKVANPKLRRRMRAFKEDLARRIKETDKQKKYLKHILLMPIPDERLQYADVLSTRERINALRGRSDFWWMYHPYGERL
jgi:hypothetical protein